jgi:hypothetical protein
MPADSKAWDSLSIDYASAQYLTQTSQISSPELTRRDKQRGSFDGAPGVNDLIPLSRTDR